MPKKLDTVFHTLNWLTYLSKKLKCSQRFYPLCHLFVYLFFNTPIYKTDNIHWCISAAIFLTNDSAYADDKGEKHAQV